MLRSPWALSTRPHPTVSGLAVVLASTLVGLTVCQALGPCQSPAGRVNTKTTAVCLTGVSRPVLAAFAVGSWTEMGLPEVTGASRACGGRCSGQGGGSHLWGLVSPD